MSSIEGSCSSLALLDAVPLPLPGVGVWGEPHPGDLLHWLLEHPCCCPHLFLVPSKSRTPSPRQDHGAATASALCREKPSSISHTSRRAQRWDLARERLGRAREAKAGAGAEGRGVEGAEKTWGELCLFSAAAPWQRCGGHKAKEFALCGSGAWRAQPGAPWGLGVPAPASPGPPECFWLSDQR